MRHREVGPRDKQSKRVNASCVLGHNSSWNPVPFGKVEFSRQPSAFAHLVDVNVALRKIANLLKPDKEIEQDGDHMIIRTLSTFRNYIMDFQVGKEFEEDLTGIDDRKCMVRICYADCLLPKGSGRLRAGLVGRGARSLCAVRL